MDGEALLLLNLSAYARRKKREVQRVSVADSGVVRNTLGKKGKERGEEARYSSSPIFGKHYHTAVPQRPRIEGRGREGGCCFGPGWVSRPLGTVFLERGGKEGRGRAVLQSRHSFTFPFEERERRGKSSPAGVVGVEFQFDSRVFT